MKKQIFLIPFFLFSFRSFSQTIKVQPYPQDVTSTSTYILWETNSSTESTVEWGTTNALGNLNSGTSFSATDNISKMHEVFLTGLSPATKYYYRVKTGTAVSSIYSFKTSPLPDSEASFTFVAMSDMQQDSGNPNKFYEICHNGIINYFNANYSGDLTDNIALLLTGGDLVMSGTTYSQWEQTYFTPAQGLLQYMPNYTILGNHEINSPNYFNYFHLPNNGPSGYIEHTWYKDYSNVRFIGLDTNFEVVNYQTQAQLDWLDTILANAASDTNIDFVIVMLHHPYKSELWIDGEVAYTGQVISRLEQFSNATGKPSMHLFGHTHGYSRGQSRSAKHFWVDLATAGGNIDYWGEFGNMDYPEFTNTQDEYGFTLFEVTAGDNPKIILKRFSRGDETYPKDNVLTDTFTVYKNPKTVNTPSAVFPMNQTVLLECVEFRASAFSSPDVSAEHGQSEWQVNTTNDFTNPLFDSWKNYENWYYNVNTQATENLTNETILGLQANTTYWWRVRYRDKEFNWSDWSTPVSFATGTSVYTANLLVNPGAESNMTGWTIEEGIVESLTNGQCGSPAPHSGSKLFAVGGICTDTPIGRATQMVDVSSYATLIDAGNYQADFGAYMRDWEGLDIPQIKIYFYNSSNGLIGNSDWLTHNTPTWTLKETFVTIPVQTRTIKFEMKGVRNNGSDNDSYIDDVFLKLGNKNIDCSGLGIGTTYNNHLKIKIFPNPVEEIGYITISDKEIQDLNFEVFNIFGEKVMMNILYENGIFVFNKHNLNSGVYFLSVFQKGKLIGSTKFIVKP